MTDANQARLSLGALTALAIGSMVGSGIFVLPSAFGRATGAAGAMIAWTIAAAGMLSLAFVFQILSRRRPDLDSGIYAYAKAGFGNYMGFVAAVGYWIGCCLADTACLVLIKATLGLFFPVFGDGTTVVAIVSASLLLWGVHLLVARGIKEAAAVNTIGTVAKLVPIAIFIAVAIAGFRPEIFAANFWGDETASLSSVASQTRNTMLVTVFVFVGIEGASVYSRYAARRKDVGLATVLGFLTVLSLLVATTMLSYGVLLRPDLAELPTPAMAGVMAALVGPWGRVFVSIGMLISILGNYLSWSLLAAEVLHSAALNGTMPSFLARENAHGVPISALWLTNIVIQVFLIVTWFAEQAFTLALKMTSAMTLVPYLLVAAYGLKLAWTGETYLPGDRRVRQGIYGGIATVYTAGMIYAGGLKFLLLSTLLYAPGTLLYLYAMKDREGPVFSPTERIAFVFIVVVALAALYALATGAIVV
ncbi:basic amino acid/polyamine antiporter [Uliginosibacterium sp. sgz301328]|uniref:basic amino acid/polyamine antiporter n=1 Tax=Uliginosibacterium sp. sgz301328 TaxID=3243764 RepID=UPI00359E2605